MKKIFFILCVFSLPLCLMAEKPTLSVGGFAGLDIPVLQDDQAQGKVFGIKAGWNVSNLFTIEPNISFTKFGDPDLSDYPGLFDGLEGSKITSFGVNALIGGSHGTMGLYPYLFAGIGSYSTKRDMTNQDDSNMGIAGGLGVEIGITAGISLDVRGKFNIIGTEGDASKKSAALTGGISYYFTK